MVSPQGEKRKDGFLLFGSGGASCGHTDCAGACTGTAVVAGRDTFLDGGRLHRCVPPLPDAARMGPVCT